MAILLIRAPRRKEDRPLKISIYNVTFVLRDVSSYEAVFCGLRPKNNDILSRPSSAIKPKLRGELSAGLCYIDERSMVFLHSY